MQKAEPMKKYSIECWLYHQRTDRFLLLRCPATHRHDEYWQPVTGGRDKDEPCMQACLREVREETGYVLHPDHVYVVIPEFSFCIPEAHMELIKPVYLAPVTSDQVTISAEHIAYCWFPSQDIADRLHWDSNRQSFHQVLEFSRSLCVAPAHL